MPEKRQGISAKRQQSGNATVAALRRRRNRRHKKRGPKASLFISDNLTSPGK
jgi:hypothetical protein